MYGESFKTEQALAFGLIWIALVLYTVSMVRNTRRVRIKDKFKKFDPKGQLLFPKYLFRDFFA